jgi:acyl-CoA synthetase (AMP-forming)/AMP-acid ligase II/thioesterase domain-containing protein/acyl carrier protein
METMAERTDRSGPVFATMYEAVRHWARLTPDAPALLAEGRAPLTYGALLRTVDAIGAALRGAGIGRNRRVALLHPGGADMAAATLGIWSHATAAPLNPSYTLGEIAVYLRDLRVDALAIAEGMDSPARRAAQRRGQPVFEIAAADDATAGAVSLRCAPIGPASADGPADAADLALLLTTSGTTSQSKIVPIRHRQLIARCRNAGGRLGLAPADRCLNLMPLYHSHGLNSGLGVSMVAGGSVLPMTSFDVARFFRCLEAEAPTWFTAVFTFHHQIHAHAKAHAAAIARSRLRLIHTSSGRLEPRIAEDLEAWFGVPLLGTYATTETGVITGDPQQPAARKRASVGTPAGVEVAVFAADGRPAAPGTRGEVRVRGPNVFDGYENEGLAGALTADGWFCTSDEGLFDADGYLFLTGRVKETINRGGEKISPSEVDEALRRHPAVADAATFAIPHATLGAEAAAAVVLHPGAAADERTLTDFLRGRLSAFKVPRRILPVDRIPLGPTGKVQRHALAAAFGLDGPAGAAPAAAPTADRPPTPLERQLQALWARTLGLPQVGLYDDFFLLGGDSLQAVELFLDIEETLGRRLPRSVLFEANTVAEMATRIASAAPRGCLVPIQQGGSRPTFFCVHNLHGEVLNFRFLAQHLGPDQPFYAVQTIGLDGTEMPLARIEQMAARYIAEIRRLQPAGPYYIGGYSMGGAVAYEMAQQLRAAGQTVGLLALFDTYPCDGRMRQGIAGCFEQDGNSLADRKPSSIVRYIARGALNLAQIGRAELRRRLFGAAWRLCERCNVTMPRPLRRPIAANYLAIRSYRMKPYDGDATLFEAERCPWERPGLHEGWNRLIRDKLEVLSVPGLHNYVMEEPHVRILSAKLERCLAKARQRGMRATEELAAAG